MTQSGGRYLKHTQTHYAQQTKYTEHFTTGETTARRSVPTLGGIVRSWSCGRHLKHTHYTRQTSHTKYLTQREAVQAVKGSRSDPAWQKHTPTTRRRPRRATTMSDDNVFTALALADLGLLSGFVDSVDGLFLHSRYLNKKRRKRVRSNR